MHLITHSYTYIYIRTYIHKKTYKTRIYTLFIKIYKTTHGNAQTCAELCGMMLNYMHACACT